MPGGRRATGQDACPAPRRVSWDAPAACREPLRFLFAFGKTWLVLIWGHRKHSRCDHHVQLCVVLVSTALGHGTGSVRAGPHGSQLRSRNGHLPGCHAVRLPGGRSDLSRACLRPDARPLRCGVCPAICPLPGQEARGPAGRSRAGCAAWARPFPATVCKSLRVCVYACACVYACESVCMCLCVHACVPTHVCTCAQSASSERNFEGDTFDC